MRKFESILGGLAGLTGRATAGLTVLVLGTAILTSVFGTPALHAAPVEVADTVDTVQPTGLTQDSGQTTLFMAAVVTPASPNPVGIITLAAGAADEVTVADGEKVFKKCKACHTVEEDGTSKTGPNLWSIVGRDVATLDGFKYSDDMAELGGVWDVALLDRYLTKPKDVVKRGRMAFAGLKKEADRQAVILYLAQQSPTPASASDLGFAGAETADAGAPETVAVVEIDDVPYPEGVTYANPPARSAEDETRIAALVAALEAEVETLDYERARFHPLHFPPAIETASNEECLVCHQEVLTATPREASPAGVPAAATIAWYQTLDTYFGDQESFHYRHLESDFAQAVMNLECTFCHQGNDPREESPDMMPGRDAFTAAPVPEFTLRKMVNPSETCLRCHGAMPDPEEIMGLADPWPVARLDFEYEEAPNGCLSCHAETYRTERHAVSYLNAANIEEIARWGSSDSCYGCHGGRSWYQISYPYPRHAWPDMDEDVPEWAVGRATTTDPRFAHPAAQ